MSGTSLSVPNGILHGGSVRFYRPEVCEQGTGFGILSEVSSQILPPPYDYYNDPFGAKQYLRGKFDLHGCSISVPKRLLLLPGSIRCPYCVENATSR